MKLICNIMKNTFIDRKYNGGEKDVNLSHIYNYKQRLKAKRYLLRSQWQSWVFLLYFHRMGFRQLRIVRGAERNPKYQQGARGKGWKNLCHTASKMDVFRLAVIDWWADQPCMYLLESPLLEELFFSRTVPSSEVSYSNFWGTWMSKATHMLELLVRKV